MSADSRAIALATAEVSLRIGELAAQAIRAIVAKNRDAAMLACAEIMELSHHLSHTHWLAADGNLTEAKKLAQNMVQKGRK